ncbi:ABC transporter ATP-binding protein [Larkinella sp. GY13]|uniref:ABC transporter ATP-binding protein n=1 Tax=Larkinella sp. GY13 TaxID=3453720 RepID=UPI003EECABC5
MKPIIKVENLSKQYRLGTIGTGTMREDVQRWWHRVRGKEDPYQKIGETNDRSSKGSSEYVWALKDINFEVMPGEVLGIIGNNGAGKSTLLKILSKVTGPTTGRIDFNGRIGSLLEVGTGFHPDLTGRENIFLNGAILGMTKREINSKLDEIINFSGCERYIDTPVKRYSSGMTVRLGFAVAAHLNPEILIVDEVLAVGDIEFQKKAIRKMQDVSRNQGRTVLFVSHNMAALRNLCTSGLTIRNGKIEGIKKGINEVVDEYMNYSTNKPLNIPIVERQDRAGTRELKFVGLKICNTHNGSDIYVGTPIIFEIHYISMHNSFVGNFLISINSDRQECLTFLESEIIEGFTTKFEKEAKIRVSLTGDISLPPGTYYLNIAAYVNGEIADHVQHALIFNVSEGQFFLFGRLPRGKGAFLTKQQWKIN